MAFLKSLGRLLLAGFVLLLLWGSAVEPRFLLDVQIHDAPIPELPTSWEGRMVALLADLQVGMWWDNTRMVEKAVARALDAGPDLILIAGDFVYKPDSTVVREAVALVAPLTRGNAPVVAVLGNHDYSLTKPDDEPREELAAYLAAELEGAGITVLENEAIAVGAGGEAGLWIAGIGSEWAGRNRPLDALSAAPDGAVHIALMHNPVAFREMPAASGVLSLAGHTHGGQVRLPVFATESWLDIARPREVVADGWAADSIGAPGNQLYVNRGLGFSAVPVRIMCKPELTLLTLRRSESVSPQDATEPGEPDIEEPGSQDDPGGGEPGGM